MAGGTPNNRVTTAEFYEKQSEMERRIIARLDVIVECINVQTTELARQDERIKKTESEIGVIQDKQEKNDLWTKIIGGATGLLTVVLTYLGLRG